MKKTAAKELEELEAKEHEDEIRAEAELVKRFRTGAFRAKMKLLFVALVANVVFITAMWLLPSIFIHAVFLGYVLIGALPKFIFGSLLRAHKPHIHDKAPERKTGDPESRRQWHISVPAFKCPRCGCAVMGSPFCKSCGFEIEQEHPILVSACVTVHHEDTSGIEGGVKSFEVSTLPFERRFFQLVYIVDGRYSRGGDPDPQQKSTIRFLLSRLYDVPESEVTNGPDENLLVLNKQTGTKQPSILEDGTAVYRGHLKGMPFAVLVKRRNKGKRDSHRLFFEFMDGGLHLARTAIGILFVDSDTKLAWENHTESLKALYLGIAKRENVGGACGEIEVEKWSKNPITMMQHFEYKSNQFLAKTAESWFGMVTCLPGAFSIVRPQALECVLNDYLADSHDIWETNQLDLGEDRTLTTLLLRNGWDTLYVSKAVAKTEVPSTLLGLIKQRRRWINSTIVNMAILVKNVRRPSAIPLLISLALELGSSFTLPTAVLMMFVEIFDAMNIYQPFVIGMVIMYVVAIVLFSMTASAERIKSIFKASASVCNRPAQIGAFMMFMMVIQIVQNLGSFKHRAWIEMTVMVGWMAIVFAAAAVHGQWSSIVTVAPPLAWLFLSPVSYVLIPIYALANFDDQSWGTRGA